MSNISINPNTNDMEFNLDGSIKRVSGKDFAIQLTKAKLETLWGEFALNPDLGFLTLEDYKRNPDLFDIEMRAMEVILSVEGVQSVDYYKQEFVDGKLFVNFIASSIYGDIKINQPIGGLV